MALSAGDVERHQDVITLFEVLNLGTDLLDDAGKLVPEGLADARIGHHAVIEMQVRPADAAARYPHDRVSGMLDPGHRLLVDPDPVGTPILHRAHWLLL